MYIGKYYVLSTQYLPTYIYNCTVYVDRYYVCAVFVGRYYVLYNM